MIKQPKLGGQQRSYFAFRSELILQQCTLLKLYVFSSFLKAPRLLCQRHSRFHRIAMSIAGFSDSLWELLLARRLEWTWSSDSQLVWWLLPSLRRLLPASRPRLQCLAKVARLGIHSRPRSPTPRKTRFLRPASRLLRPVSRRHRLRPRRRRLRPRSLHQCLSRVRMCASWAALASERNGSSRSSGWTSCGWWTSGSLFPTRADIQRLKAESLGMWLEDFDTELKDGLLRHGIWPWVESAQEMMSKSLRSPAPQPPPALPAPRQRSRSRSPPRPEMRSPSPPRKWLTEKDLEAMIE